MGYGGTTAQKLLESCLALAPLPSVILLPLPPHHSSREKGIQVTFFLKEASPLHSGREGGSVVIWQDGSVGLWEGHLELF